MMNTEAVNAVNAQPVINARRRSSQERREDRRYQVETDDDPQEPQRAIEVPVHGHDAQFVMAAATTRCRTNSR